MIIELALSMVMNFTPPTVHDTRDLDFRVPNFDNAPRFDMRDGVRGRNPIRQSRETRPRLRENNDDLVLLLRKEFGDKYKIIRWRGKIIVIKEDNRQTKRRNRGKRRR